MMNPEESLDIIARMMSQTRRSVLSDVYLPFLVWGWSTMAICMIVYLGLVLTGDFEWNYVWLLLPVLGLHPFAGVSPFRLFWCRQPIQYNR